MAFPAALSLSAQQGFVLGTPPCLAPPHPGSLPPCPRQLGSLAQPPELPLMATFGCGPTGLHTGTAVPSQAAGLWADGKEGSQMLLLGSPSPSRCHPLDLLPSPPESLGWTARRNRQTFKDGLGTLLQKWDREDLALRASRAWGGGDTATGPQREGPKHWRQRHCRARAPRCGCCPLKPRCYPHPAGQPCFISSVQEWLLHHLKGSQPPHLANVGPRVVGHLLYPWQHTGSQRGG